MANKWFWIAFGALLAAYSPTLIYPYVLTDEAWIIRPNTYSWVYPTGRPLFAFLAWIEAEIAQSIGLKVIYVMRVSAILGLAVSALILAKWFEYWGQQRVTAFCIALCLMTLPAYQVVVADGTQLAIVILLSVYATHRFFSSPQRLWVRCVISGTLLIVGLLIYQQQILLALGMLAVPLLSQRDWTTYKRIVAYGTLVALVSVSYFVAWTNLHQYLWPGKIDTRYGPDAVQFPGVDQLIEFVDTRIPQVAGLWNVDQPSLNTIVLAALILMLVKLVSDAKSKSRMLLASYPMLLGLMIAADGFVILARAYPSYITATALTLVVFYWAFSGVQVVLSRWTKYAAVMACIVGVAAAFMTVKDEIAEPNWQHMQRIEEAIRVYPNAKNFHILGVKEGGLAFQEFGWRNANTDVYLDLIVVNVIDDLVKRGKISKRRRDEMYHSIGGVSTWSAPDSTQREVKPDSVIVSLD